MENSFALDLEDNWFGKKENEREFLAEVFLLMEVIKGIDNKAFVPVVAVFEVSDVMVLILTYAHFVHIIVPFFSRESSGNGKEKRKIFSF